MAHQVHWTEKICKNFIDKAMLSEEEAYIIRSRVKGSTVTEQALHLNKSEATVHRMIARLKKKYDAIQKEFPNDFPIRRTSKQEEYMDTH